MQHCGMTANSLRHSYATSTSLQMGQLSPERLKAAAKLLAHTNTETLSRYYVWGA
jgi:hypothetical protein